MNPSNGYLIRLGPGNTGFSTIWLDCQRVEAISLNAKWTDAITASLIVEGTDEPGILAPLDTSGISQYSLPSGCLHPSLAGITLGPFAAGFGKPVAIAGVPLGRLLLELTNQSRWLRVRLDTTAGGGAFDWTISYTLRFYQ